MDRWKPYMVEADSYQTAWVNASRHILSHGGTIRNLLVCINNPADYDQDIHRAITTFCDSHKLKTPKQVAYTIFPEGLARKRDAASLFHHYNRRSGFFDRVKTGWGTYFRRLTHYDTPTGPVNQLERIIHSIQRDAGTVWKAAYTMIVQYPGSETTQRRGGPCLNYLALQLEKPEPARIGLLAVYRHHDFLERAYGNYHGLSNLLRFICRETDLEIGPLICLSSRAYVGGKVRALRKFLEQLA